MYKVFLNLTLLLITISASMAQDVELTLKAPSNASVGRPFRVELSINTQGAQLEEPKFDSNFRVLARGENTSMSFINGVTSIKSSYVYTVVANKAGKFTIHGGKAVKDGKTYTSNSVTIEVEEGDVANQNNNQNNNSQNNVGNLPNPSQSDNIFIDVTTNKSEVYVGEQVLLTSSLYSRYDIAEFSDVKFPNFAGFWSMDIHNPKNIRLERKVINGNVYLYTLWQKKALFPQKSGSLTIEPYTINCIIRDSYGFRQAIATANSKPKTITIKPLPSEGKPENFGGAVGKFTVSASTDKTDVKLDEPLTLNFKVSGAGNFQLFATPKFELPAAFEQFEPKTAENISTGENGISGSKTFSTVLIARQSGTFTIPPIKFPYFDPASKSYKVAESQPIEITISGERDTTQAMVSTLVKTDIEDLGTDIRFIKKDGVKLYKGESKFFNTTNFWLLFILLPIIFVVVILLRLQQIKNNANIAGVRNRKAGRTSRKRLKLAATYIKQNKKDEFYVEVLNALWGYLSDKLAIPRAELSRDNVQDKFSEKEIDPEVTKKFIETLDTCEFEHYAPESASHPLSEVYTMAAEAIEQMETSIKA
jgi:hypothetical protein